eukprot:5766889-Pyramimonas_sp.AAC.2
MTSDATSPVIGELVPRRKNSQGRGRWGAGGLLLTTGNFFSATMASTVDLRSLFLTRTALCSTWATRVLTTAGT